MKIHRIYAITLRYMYNFKHSYDRLTDAFYWPAMDLLLWGLTGYYFISAHQDSTNILHAVISGMIFWIIIWRAQYEITINLLTELWDKNLINLFGAPLKFWEWVISTMLLGILKGIPSFLFAAGLAYWLYGVDVFAVGWYAIIFILLLLLSGWGIGSFVASFLFRYGTKIQTFGWSFIWIFAPFSAIYYPVSILPEWAQVFSKLLPMSYVFEQIRSLIFYHTVDYKQLLISFVLSILYLTVGLLFMRKSFDKLLNRGLAKLY